MRDLVGREGTLLSWTVVRVPPSGFADQAPYVVGVIVLASGKHITAQIVDADPSQMKQGLPVRTVVRRITHPSSDGVIPYGIKAIPL